MRKKLRPGFHAGSLVPLCGLVEQPLANHAFVPNCFFSGALRDQLLKSIPRATRAVPLLICRKPHVPGAAYRFTLSLSFILPPTPLPFLSHLAKSKRKEQAASGDPPGDGNHQRKVEFFAFANRQINYKIRARLRPLADCKTHFLGPSRLLLIGAETGGTPQGYTPYATGWAVVSLFAGGRDYRSANPPHCAAAAEGGAKIAFQDSGAKATFSPSFQSNCP